MKNTSRFLPPMPDASHSARSDQLIIQLYQRLFHQYGPQGWWPLRGLGTHALDKTGSRQGYHPGDYSYPHTRQQRWEIIMGALLTQNTNWVAVTRALENLWQEKIYTPEALAYSDDHILRQAIRPAGYYNQKAQRLKSLAQWFLETTHVPDRHELLAIDGIGPETADSILLYVYQEPHFIIDAYTRRIAYAMGIIASEKIPYMHLKKMFESAFVSETGSAVEQFQEYHALLVEHGKRFYSRKPWGVDDPVRQHLAMAGTKTSSTRDSSP